MPALTRHSICDFDSFAMGATKLSAFEGTQLHAGLPYLVSHGSSGIEVHVHLWDANLIRRECLCIVMSPRHEVRRKMTRHQAVVLGTIRLDRVEDCTCTRA